jgi:hypothetical protein
MRTHKDLDVWKNGGCSKNSHCHSERSEESHVSLFKSNDRKRDPSAFGLRMIRKGKFTKILEHPLRIYCRIRDTTYNIKRIRLSKRFKHI